MNRAMDGDIVAVELLPEESWTSPSEIVLEDKTVRALINNKLTFKKSFLGRCR